SYGLPGAAWVPPEQMHLTLRFLGEVDGETFTMIREALGGVQSRKFHLSLKGVGHFPKRGDPEVLWVGIAGGDEVIRLRNRIESLLVKRGVEPDARKFHPHVTLARIKDTKALWIGRYLIDNSLFALHEIPVQAFHLYSSRLTPAGAEHTLEASYPLEGVLEAVD
ncbi:MAG TPA: RNA 2',3'-cyclic phosphodiesterase, partial [Fibrobacteria bacterium]|nr:RNA 2',3'-cyclic phosphodiesterase [Fibrobacteria bacterium]